MCDDADGILATPYHIHTISICHPQNAHNFFGWEMKWPAPYYLIFSFHSYPLYKQYGHSNIHFHICMVFVARICVYSYIFRYLIWRSRRGVMAEKVYTTQDKTHTTNGWKKIKIFHLFVYVLELSFFPSSREYTLRYGIGRKYSKKFYVWQDIT